MNPADLTEAHGKSLMCTYLGYKLERLEEVSGGGGGLVGRRSVQVVAGRKASGLGRYRNHLDTFARGDPAVGRRRAKVCLCSHLLPCLPGGSKNNKSHLRGQQQRVNNKGSTTKGQQ